MSVESYVAGMTKGSPARRAYAIASDEYQQHLARREALKAEGYDISGRECNVQNCLYFRELEKAYYECESEDAMYTREAREHYE